MDDSISRQSAIEILGKHCNMDYGKVCGKDCECVEYLALRDTPSAQKKGHWVKQNPMVDTEECSVCGYNIYSAELETPFCPWCGADMREEATE